MKKLGGDLFGICLVLKVRRQYLDTTGDFMLCHEENTVKVTELEVEFEHIVLIGLQEGSIYKRDR